MALLTVSILVSATTPQAMAVPPAETIEGWDRDHRRQAAILGRASFRSTEPALRSGLEMLDERSDPWRPLTSTAMIERASAEQYSTYANKRSFNVSASVDYDGDGRSDLVEMVENSTQGGIRVTFGGDRARRAMIVFKMNRRWGQEEIYAAGRRRILIQKPELGYTLLLLRNGEHRAVYIGD